MRCTGSEHKLKRQSGDSGATGSRIRKGRRELPRRLSDLPDLSLASLFRRVGNLDAGPDIA